MAPLCLRCGKCIEQPWQTELKISALNAGVQAAQVAREKAQKKKEAQKAWETELETGLKALNDYVQQQTEINKTSTKQPSENEEEQELEKDKQLLFTIKQLNFLKLLFQASVVLRSQKSNAGNEEGAGEKKKGQGKQQPQGEQQAEIVQEVIKAMLQVIDNLYGQQREHITTQQEMMECLNKYKEGSMFKAATVAHRMYKQPPYDEVLEDAQETVANKFVTILLEIKPTKQS